MSFPFLKQRRATLIVSSLFLLVLVGLIASGKASYPFILTERQFQLWSHCQFGTPSFSDTSYGFRLSAPSDHCFLPNRLYPKDSMIQLLPSGWYSVLGEYGKGSVANAADITLLFEPITEERNPDAILGAFQRGGFLDDGGTFSEYTNPNGVPIRIVHHVRGTDASQHFDWAFATNDQTNMLFSLVLQKEEEQEFFRSILDGIQYTN